MTVHDETDKKELSSKMDRSAGAAVVFVRRNATFGVGHVGWGFLIHSGEGSDDSLVGDGNVWEIGAVENHHGGIFTGPLDDGYWNKNTSQPLLSVAERKYDHYKVFPVANPNMKRAFEEEAAIKERPYIAAVGNCMNDVFHILTAYGASSLPHPDYIANWLPNVWYAHIDAPEFAIDDPTGLNRAPAAKDGVISGASAPLSNGKGASVNGKEHARVDRPTGNAASIPFFLRLMSVLSLGAFTFWFVRRSAKSARN